MVQPSAVSGRPAPPQPGMVGRRRGGRRGGCRAGIHGQVAFHGGKGPGGDRRSGEAAARARAGGRDRRPDHAAAGATGHSHGGHAARLRPGDDHAQGRRASHGNVSRRRPVVRPGEPLLQVDRTNYENAVAEAEKTLGAELAKLSLGLDDLSKQRPDVHKLPGQVRGRIDHLDVKTLPAVVRAMRNRAACRESARPPDQADRQCVG